MYTYVFCFLFIFNSLHIIVIVVFVIVVVIVPRFGYSFVYTRNFNERIINLCPSKGRNLIISNIGSSTLAVRVCLYYSQFGVAAAVGGGAMLLVYNY